MKPIKFSNVFLINPRGEVLVLRRTASHPTRPLAPDLPGGLLNTDEDYGQAAIREVREETGLDIGLKDITLVRHTRKVYPDRILDGAIYMATLPTADVPITLSNEHDECHWISPLSIKDLPEFHQSILNYALKAGILH